MTDFSSEIGSMKKEHTMQDEEVTIKPKGFVKISQTGFPIKKMNLINDCASSHKTGSVLIQN